jgi:hypothetical protein
MPKKYIDPYAMFPEDRKRLAEELVDIFKLKQIDFTPSESNKVKNDFTVQKISRNGKFYQLKINIVKDKFVEIVAIVYNTHPDKSKYTDYTIETCYVYHNYNLKYYDPATCTKIEKYIIQEYRKYSATAAHCFFCEQRQQRWKTPTPTKSHLKTKKHETNKKNMILNLTDALNLPYDITVMIIEKLPYK